MKCKMTAKTCVNPTEDLDKVITALLNIFKYDNLIIEDGYIIVTGEIDSLIQLKNSLKERKIQDTAERIFIKGASNGIIKFSLSKQAAFVSIPNIVDRELSALGEIDVTIKTDNELAFIEWMTKK